VEGRPVNNEDDQRGVGRRDFIKRTAVVGGTLLWAGPAIQSLTPKAYAHVVSPAQSCCCECRDAGTLMFCGSSTNFTGMGNTSTYMGGNDPAACTAYCNALHMGDTGTLHCGPGTLTCGTNHLCSAH
jgi:hypothetical protein